ncbi:hypothetical protein EB796_011459 [Bugula neritina]|uniref:Uncharacterized protein n=1 Tax=Bugula neritina TaxID=10212 RepID=A0A7J7JWF6_BUGNE|nr:hypothetical protein EB796_011459 [Bugula neritina]
MSLCSGVGKRPAKYIGETSYGVELIDVSSDTDVYISQELITTGLAAARKLDILQQLNMKHEAEQLDYHHQLIPKLVRLLNVTTNHDRRVLITQCIHQLVQQSSNLKYEMKRDGIVKSLCYLVNTVNLHDDLLYHILDCFAIFTTNHIANCEEMWWERGFNYLHELLDICDDNGILTKVLICFKNLINSNSVRQEVDSLETFTINLVYVARTSTILQNRVLSLHIFNTYVQGEVKRVTLLMKHDIVKVLTDILSVNSDSLIESSCQLISTLVSLNSKQPSTQPWTDTLSTLVNRMFKITADSALCSCAKTYVMLKNLSGATAMLKSTQLHDKLQRLMNSGLNAQTREACINLLVNIKPDEPPPSEGVSAVQPSSSSPHNAMVRKKQTILLKPICKDQAQPIREKRVPPILWWECSQFLMIHVQIHNASNLTPPPKLNYKQGKLHFECGEFEFKLGPLYEKIVSRRSRRELLASEIKYALYKEIPALWSKLMKAGYKKPSYVQPHMDLMVTSSDDESHIDYNQSPFLIKPAPTLKYQTFESITSEVSLRAPPAEEFATSEEEESDEEDERYDETYRSQYDFFNI